MVRRRGKLTGERQFKSSLLHGRTVHGKGKRREEERTENRPQRAHSVRPELGLGSPKPAMCTVVFVRSSRVLKSFHVCWILLCGQHGEYSKVGKHCICPPGVF